MAAMNDSRSLIEALRDPGCYPHPVPEVVLHETHANWVLLAGDYAYKIKKPVDLGFLDFSSLEKRLFYCREEIRLNQRLAPDIYDRVVPISGSSRAPRLDDDDAPFEYAVRMQRFDPDDGLDRLLESGGVPSGAWDDFARDMAQFHRDAPWASRDSGHGVPEQLWEQMRDNFRDIAPRLSADDDRARLSRIEAWARECFDRARPHLEQRLAEGRVRECHGDLHCANLVLHGNRIQAFDCLEFNADLRWIDTANEIAFLLMDLRYRGQPGLAARWRSHYLEWLGDYDAVPLLPLYEHYRALVRCKVALLAAEQAADDPDRAEQQRETARRYLKAAADCTHRRDPWIIITHGLAASGKSTVGLGVLEQFPALRLRSDVERKRLFDLDPLDTTDSGVGEGIYSPDATDRTYARLAEQAGRLAADGEAVLVDATFLDRRKRDLLRETAEAHGVPFTILHATAPRAVLEERIRERQAAGRDASEANTEVLDAQIEHADALSPEEERHTVSVDTTEPVDYPALAGRIRAMAR